MLPEKDIPQIIKDVGFGFNWSEKKVWKLDIPATDMEIDELVWHFEIPFLWENGIYNLKPRNVMDNPQEYEKEYARAMQTDLTYPIDIMENKGRWVILDGLHRLMKASILGAKTVRVRKVSRECIPDILE